MWNKIKNWFFPKEEKLVYTILVQEEPEGKVEVMKKAAAKKPPAKKAPVKKAPVKKPVKKNTKKK